MLGPVLGGVFTQHATWRWCKSPNSSLIRLMDTNFSFPGFYVNLPLGGVAALFIGLISIPEHIEKHSPTPSYLRSILPHVDLTGFALFAPAAVMLLLALQFGSGEYGWDSSRVIGLFVGAGVTAIIFLLWERRVGAEAMIPLQMVGKRIVWSSSCFGAMLMMSAMVGNNFMPIYLQSVKGLEPTMSGVYMLAAVGSQIVFVVVSGALGKSRM